MKKSLLNLLLVLFIITQLPLTQLTAQEPVSADSSFNDLIPEPLHPRVEQLITTILSRFHYKKIQLDDSLSSQIFDRYLESMDYNRVYFLQSDLDRLEKYRYEIIHDIENGVVMHAFFIFNIFRDRFQERYKFIEQRLDKPFDYTIDEDYKYDRKDASRAETTAQLDSIWRKRLKNDALNLVLAGKTEEEARTTLKKRYKRLYKRMGQYQSEDVFQLFMNAFAGTYDPHTNYFSPKAKDDFNIRMRQSLEGIGARLMSENDYTKIVEIIPGGPAAKEGSLQPNDRITAVAQDEDGEMVDIIGWRIDDVVQLIRGKKGTVVRLKIIPAGKKAGDPQTVIRIVRDKVKLEDSIAESDTLEIFRNGGLIKIGIIHVPSFYLDWDGMRNHDPDYHSTTRDVKKLITELTSAGVQGILIDLRRDGGGFLTEAVNLTGLFIHNGPVVQVRKSDGSIKVETITDEGVHYDGPLVVLVDNFSASASEIFAAAIQDYGRGLIVGTQSYGKGTVQNAMDLNRFFPNTKHKFGQIKLTIAKFYRINGGSTQHKGVLPDIDYPSRWSAEEVGESSNKNALLWDQINPLSYQKIADNPQQFIPKLQNKFTKRTKEDKEYKEYVEEIDKFKKDRLIKTISLNEEERKKEREENEKKDSEKEENNDDRDVILKESANILVDLIILST
jgi:carboxyl-terminal processing protease